jgi:HlyD family secretion protein
VTQKYATVGAFVTPTTSASNTSSATSTSIVAVAQDLEILAKIAEVDIGQIRIGQPVEINVDAYPEQVFKGRVRLISPEAIVDQNVTTFQVRVSIVTGQKQLLSGMNSDLMFLGKRVDDALVIPTVAIATQKGQTGVYIPDKDKKPKFQPITIGASVKTQTQVLEGLTSEQRVFIDYPKGLEPKQPEDGKS